MLDWMQLIVTALLLLVTGWYARTTRTLAKIAARTAKDSVRAATAAERAASFAQAQVQPRFNARQITVAREGRRDAYQIGVLIESAGAVVVVTEVRARIGSFELRDGGDERRIEALTLEPMTQHDRLPRRLHGGERAHFSHAELQTREDERLTALVLELDYKFAEGDAACETLVIRVDVPLPPQVF